MLAFIKSITSRKMRTKRYFFHNKNQCMELLSESDDDILSKENENEQLEEIDEHDKEVVVDKEPEADAVKVEEETNINDNNTKEEISLPRLPSQEKLKGGRHYQL